MVTSEIIQQVFHIKTQFGTGTGFAVRIDGRQYLITARHVLDGDSSEPLGERVNIHIRQADRWHELNCILVGVGSDPFDIAVLALPRLLTNFPEIALGTKGLMYGQEAYFLGFPYGIEVNFGAMNNHFPLPYVKKAIVSMINGLGQSCVVLDGINNIGFSGGPVVFRNQIGSWQIAAVISGFNSVREPVYIEKSDEQSQYTHDSNTGLIDACPMDIAQDLVRINPIGYSY